MSFRQLIRMPRIIGPASAALAVIVAGSAFAASHGGPEALASTANSHTVSSSGSSSGGASAQPTTTPSTPAKPLVPLQVASVALAGGTQATNGAAPVKVTFNEQLAASTPLPTLSPKVSGSWTVSGATATFQPQLGYAPGTSVTLTIPGGTSGVQAAGRTTTGTATAGAGLLAKTKTVHFTTGTYSVTRLQQLLTQLGYLPLTWTPDDPSTGTVPAGDANAQLSAAYQPPAGSFAFQSGYPWQLTSQWRSGKDNTLDKGAIMAFQYDNGLTMDGVAGTDVWSHLMTAVAHNKQNPNGYTYSLADQHSPETLRVWHNGKQILKTLVNTGVPGAGTADGTYPVYERFQVTEMKGTNPDGSKYDDTVRWVSYFNGGDALHYFPRPGYGYYQSVGCVEMPLNPAKYIWNYTTYGSLVTVTGPMA